jgi:hypothetical protein
MIKRLALVIALSLCAAQALASTLYIDEYAQQSVVTYPAAQAPPITSQTVAISGTAASSSAFNTATRLIRITCDVVCSFLIGTTPTATTSNARMSAGQTEYFVVQPGFKISVISNS